MDDPRSNVSSFYGSGGRRSSFNPDQVLSSQRPSPPGQHTHVDSLSSPALYNPHRLSQNSADLLAGDAGAAGPRGTAGSAGYNRTSFFAPGREEPVKGGRDEQQPLRTGEVGAGGQDEGWDVFADFNNVGPRYSTAFRTGDAGCVSHRLVVRFRAHIRGADTESSPQERPSRTPPAPSPRRARAASSS